MKSLALFSTHPAQGKTTICVNLAAGLAKLGYKTIILEVGDPALLKMWLNIEDSVPPGIIKSTDMGFDILLSPVANIDNTTFEKYDFVIVDTGTETTQHINILDHTDLITACTDLRIEDRIALPSLDRLLSSATVDKHGIDLVIPTIINTKEWGNNSEVLFDLLDYFGEERIADMVPE